MRLEKAAIIRVLHEEPTLSEMFLSHLLTRTMRVEEDLVDQLQFEREALSSGTTFYWRISARIRPSRCCSCCVQLSTTS